MKKKNDIYTPIGWTDITWNIAVGCSKISPGCKYCYMMRDFGKKPQFEAVNGTVTRTQPGTFDKPLKLHRQGLKSEDGGRLKVFTCSLTDFFHEQIDSYRHEAWEIIRQCPDFIFQILTKRPERIKDHLPDDWGDGWENVWIGVSVESNEQVWRINKLHEIPARLKFISFEPLLSMIKAEKYIAGYHCQNCNSSEQWLDQSGEKDTIRCFYCDGELKESRIDWIIIGGESGNDKGPWNYRECKLEWIERIVIGFNIAHDVKTYIKQTGTYLSRQLKKGYKLGLWDEEIKINRHGTEYRNLPESLNWLNLREIPVT